MSDGTLESNAAQLCDTLISLLEVCVSRLELAQIIGRGLQYPGEFDLAYAHILVELQNPNFIKGSVWETMSGIFARGVIQDFLLVRVWFEYGCDRFAALGLVCFNAMAAVDKQVWYAVGG